MPFKGNPSNLHRIRDARRLASALDKEAPTYDDTDDEWKPGNPKSDAHSGDHAADGTDTVSPSSINALPTANLETGSQSFSGDGTATVFTIGHNLGSTPSWATVLPRSADAAGDHWVSAVSSTGVEVTFAAAPASGTDNVVFDYDLRL